MSDLVDIMAALAGQIEDQIGGTADPAIELLQVVPLLTPNPTPPCIDVYPSDPFQEPLTFGRGDNAMFLTVRARVDVADNEDAQYLLLSMMDPQSDQSVAAAIASDSTLSSEVEHADVVSGPSDYGLFNTPGGRDLLGCTWNVRIFP